MSFAAAGANRDPQRSLRAARQLTLRRLAVDQKATSRPQIVGSASAIRALFLPDDEEDVDALLTIVYQTVGSDHHRGCNPFRVRRTASKKSRSFQARRNERRHRVEVG